MQSRDEQICLIAIPFFYKERVYEKKDLNNNMRIMARLKEIVSQHFLTVDKVYLNASIHTAIHPMLKGYSAYKECRDIRLFYDNPDYMAKAAAYIAKRAAAPTEAVAAGPTEAVAEAHTEAVAAAPTEVLLVATSVSLNKQCEKLARELDALRAQESKLLLAQDKWIAEKRLLLARASELETALVASEARAGELEEHIREASDIHRRILTFTMRCKKLHIDKPSTQVHEQTEKANSSDSTQPVSAAVAVMGCRDMEKCFKHKQHIRHTINMKNTWVGTYDASRNIIICNGESYKSVCGFTNGHYKSNGLSYGHRDGWGRCECEIDGKWISTYSLPG
jgi:hypothetical protein